MTSRRKSKPHHNKARGLFVKYCSKEHYKVFLRLNDRKQRQSVADFEAAGYPISTSWEFTKFNAYAKWCNEQYGPYGYISIVNFWIFENKQDQLLFKMRWE